jgi:hypothetical protein
MQNRNWITSIFSLLILCIPAIGNAGQTLNLPKVDRFGQPVDVGLLILGHSTSNQGDYPAKLALALNQNLADGRNYLAFKAFTTGDGGFLWSRLSIPPSDVQYNRVLVSKETAQWCEDNTGVRWSCRRTKLHRALTNKEPAPQECNAATTGCKVSSRMLCVWHENNQSFSESLSFNDCWAKMDVRLALVMDTSNRSWPIDDYNSDGEVNNSDFFPAESIAAEALPCKKSTGVINADGISQVDWNCDGRLNASDSVATVYEGWLEKLALDLLNTFGKKSVQHVFFSQKPVEMFSPGLCNTYFPDENSSCDYHALRTATPSRPFDHFYLPATYWEYRSLEIMAAKTTLDKRIHLVTDTDVHQMWNRSAQCYAEGIESWDWTIPQIPDRPISITADDSESENNDSANKEGCMISDHIHPNTNGGWMIADVWYAGLQSYLQ